MMVPIADRIHRAALLAYPRVFRARFGREIAAIFNRRISAARANGRARAIALAMWLCLDTIVSGLAERLRARRHHRGGVTVRGEVQPSRSETMTFESIAADARLALRTFRRAPAFAAATILTLGLGIGASTAIFAVAHAVLLRPLPYADPDRLVAIWSHNTRQNELRNPVSPANFEAFRRDASSFEGIEAIFTFFVNMQIEQPGSKEMLTVSRVSPGMFDLIGRAALHGRGLREGDDNGIVLSRSLWLRRFGGDEAVIGSTVRMTGVSDPLTVVGVMPEDFLFPYASMFGSLGSGRARSADAWLLLPRGGNMTDAAGQPNRSVHMLGLVGRLKPGTSLDAARVELETIASRREAEFPDTNEGWKITALPLHEQVVGRVKPAVLLLTGGVGLLMLMTCLNIANVLLARATGRRRDWTVRAALGASAARLAQQSLVESALLAVLGGLAGVAVVVVGMQGVMALAPADLPRLHEARIDLAVAGFAAALSIVTGLVIGFLPALSSMRVRAAATSETHRTTSSSSSARMRGSLVVVEIAVATVLLVGGALMLRTFIAVLHVDPGFRSEHLLTFQQFVPDSAQTPAARVAFLDEYLTRLAAIPGVASAGGSTRIPLGSTQVTTQLTIEGRDEPVNSRPEVDMRRAIGDYFRTMGMPVLRGRVFEPADRTATSGLAVVNAALAARVFPGEEAIGRRVRLGPNPDALWLRIIGVVGDIRHGSLEDDPRPEIYISHLQGPPVAPFMAVRTTGDAGGAAAGVRRVAESLGADPPFNVSTMAALRSESMALRRFVVLLAGLFGVLALVLAAVGIYGVTSLSVAERTDEVGVRVALGATPGRILSLVVSHAARLGAMGIAVGIGVGVVLAQIARSLLFGVSAFDLVTFTAAPAVLLVVAIAAALVPARRATKISPLDAMKGRVHL
jgi:predicted permease